MSYLLVFLVPFLLSLAITPLVSVVAGKLNIVAKPKEDRWHKKVVPILGGVAIYASFLVSYLLFLPKSPVPAGLIIGVTAIFILGLVDDIKKLSPQNKMIGQIICASLAVIFGVTIKLIPIPAVAIPLTIFWIVGIANAFNLLDNMDGLSSGVAVIAALTLFVCSIILKNYEIAVVSLLLAGSISGFLPYNFYPARIFMGDCGAMFLGFALACLTIEGTWKQASNLFIVMVTPVLALAVPIFDTAFVTITRKMSGVSIAQGGKDHTSHRLVFLGLPEKRAVITLYAISVIFGLAALTSLFLKIYVSVVLIAVLFISFFAFGAFLGYSGCFRKEPSQPVDEQDIPYYKDETALVDSLIKYKRVIFEISCDLCLICLAYVASYVIRYEGAIDTFNLGLITKSLPILIVVKLCVFYASGVYGNIWRYIGLSELLNIVKGILIGSVASIMVLVVVFRFQGFSRMIFVLDAMVLLILMSGVRIAFRLFKEQVFIPHKAKGRKILIVGAGDAGDAFLREIRKNKQLNYRPVGFIDDNPSKIGRRIQGVAVLGARTDIPNLVREREVEEVIIAIPSADRKTIENLAAICRESGAEYREISGIFWK